MQPTDERYNGNIFIAIVYQHLLALKGANAVFKALPWFHFHHKEMITILLELSPGSKLVVEGVSYIFEALEEVIWK